MNLTEEQKEMVINMGAYDYPPEKIASVLGVNLKDLFVQLNKDESEINLLLQKGKDMSDYAIDTKLFEMSRAGDIKALEKLEQRKRLRYTRK